MFVTAFDIKTLVIPVRFKNALSAMFVTEKMIEPTVTESGIVISPVAEVWLPVSTVAVFCVPPTVNV